MNDFRLFAIDIPHFPGDSRQTVKLSKWLV